MRAELERTEKLEQMRFVSAFVGVFGVAAIGFGLIGEKGWWGLPLVMLGVVIAFAGLGRTIHITWILSRR